MSIMDDDKIENELLDDESLNEQNDDFNHDDVSIQNNDDDDDDDDNVSTSSFVDDGDIPDGNEDVKDINDNESIASDEEIYDLSQNNIDYMDEDDIMQPDKATEDKNLDLDISDEEFDDDDDDSLNEDSFKKIDNIEIEDYTKLYHNDIYEHNADEVQALSKVTRDEFNNIIDDLHQTVPILSKYERARILGQRAKQLNAGSPPFVTLPKDTIDGYLIAIQELEAKRIPFIIRRPLPFGGCEYWKVSDLEII